MNIINFKVSMLVTTGTKTNTTVISILKLVATVTNYEDGHTVRIQGGFQSLFRSLKRQPG